MDLIAANIVPLAFILAAAVIGASGHDGWGWCIFGAIITTR